jgi:hypothetical protein
MNIYDGRQDAEFGIFRGASDAFLRMSRHFLEFGRKESPRYARDDGFDDG